MSHRHIRGLTMTRLGWMYQIGIPLLLGLARLACYPEDSHPTAVGCPDPIAIIKTLTSSDTLGNPTSQLHYGDSFYLLATVRNNTGKSQPFSYTAPLIDIYIFRSDTAVASSTWHIAFAQFEQYGTFSKDSSWTLAWKAPQSAQANRNLPLRPALYVARLFVAARFDSLEVTGVDTLAFTISQ